MEQSTINRSSVHALFRRCIRSVQAMPDANRQESYRIYVRDAFHRRANMLSDSREAWIAYRDGLEQVESMEYYHEQARVNKNEGRMKIKPADFSHPTLSTSIKVVNPEYVVNQTIAEWLLRHLPHLNDEDVAKYSNHLVDEGFDS